MTERIQQLNLSFDEIDAIQSHFYPNAPGFKSYGTSELAAREVAPTAQILRVKVLDLLRTQSLTADECASALGVSPFACRPRLTELYKGGLIVSTGEKRRNVSGKWAMVFRAK